LKLKKKIPICVTSNKNNKIEKIDWKNTISFPGMNNKITNFLLLYMNMRGWIYENLFFGIQIRLIYNPILPKSPTDSVVSARHLNTYLINYL